MKEDPLFQIRFSLDVSVGGDNHDTIEKSRIPDRTEYVFQHGEYKLLLILGRNSSVEPALTFQQSLDWDHCNVVCHSLSASCSTASAKRARASGESIMVCVVV